MDIDDLDPSNPNIDGDFKALFQVKKRRKKSSAVGTMGIIIDEVDETTSPARSELDILKDDLFRAVRGNDIRLMTGLLTRLHLLELDISSRNLCDADTGQTALHVAIQNKNREVALYLINACKSDAYLTATYSITVRNTPSSMTSLLLLAESGDEIVIKALLEKISDWKKKRDYLQKVTLMELEGQRPRDFSAIHIAALHGHTNLINLLHGLGVDVNLLNSKEDTPALWAARGNRIDTMRRLIQLKADVNHQNDKGSTPLYWAVRYGLSEMVRLLVTEGNANIHHRRKLGLVSPVVMAASLGYADILTTLLTSGADANTKITNNQTALHMAAAIGNDNIVEILEKFHVDCDPVDDTGSTPLHMAAKNGHTNPIKLLCAYGASLEARDRVGKTVWDYAMESDDIAVLKTLVEMYRRNRRMTRRQLIFPKGTNPLHMAARLGDVEKIQYLINEGADPHAKDQSGNTLFHVAAREDQPHVLTAFLGNGDINVQNEDLDIPIHIASRRGHFEAVKVLIKKSKLYTPNENGYTPLHDACSSDNASAAVVGTLVENIVANNNWSLIDAIDSHGNTALHIAALRDRADIIHELKPLNPCILNHNGDNPFHLAAKKGNNAVLFVMFEVFNKPGKGLNLDEDNAEGETILHICAKVGSHELVATLIDTGADLVDRNKQGNTVLHEMAEEIVTNPSRTELLLVVYQEIVECATVWWCIKHDLPRPDRSSDSHREFQRSALLYMTSDVYNHAGYNVLGYCVKVGALALFNAILETDNICRLSKGKVCMFDITNMTPDTNTENLKKSKNGKIGVITDDELDNEITPNTKSYLDIVTELDDDIQATQFLDVTPLRQLSENLWAAYQWIYVLLMIIQMTYMSCLSVFTIPAVAIVYNTTSSTDANQDPTVFPFVLFLIWPFFLIVFQIVAAVNMIRRYVNHSIKKPVKSDVQDKKCCNSSCRISSIPGTILNGLFSNMAGIAAVIFAVCVTAWYALYIMNHRNQVYLLAITMLVGWMLTIVFTKGFKSVHALSTMLSYIIIRDVTRFIIIYLFILLGCAFAMHTLFRIPQPVAEMYNSSWDTIFLTFNLMLGMADLFDEDFDQSYADAGSSSEWVKFFYLFYMILATIIMLNLLIAMLSDTYNEIKSKEGTTWRVTSVRLALSIERWMPFLKKMVLKMGLTDMNVEYNEESRRWIMRLPLERVVDENKQTVTELSKGLHRLETQIDAMEAAFGEISNKLDDVVTEMQVGRNGDVVSARDSISPRRRSSTVPNRRRRSTKASIY